MRGEGAQAFPVGNRRTPGHAGDNHALGNAGEGVFEVQGGRRAAEGADAGAGIVGNAERVEPVHLLADRPVETGIPGVQTHGVQRAFLRPGHNGDDFLQRHFRAVVDGAALLAVKEQLGIYQRAGVNDHVRIFKQFFSAQRDQVRSPAPRANKMNHIFYPFHSSSQAAAGPVAQRMPKGSAKTMAAAVSRPAARFFR